VVRRQPPHDELPRRGRDARDARLARRVERDAIAPDVPQLRVRVFGQVDRLLLSTKKSKKPKKASRKRPKKRKRWLFARSRFFLFFDKTGRQREVRGKKKILAS